MNKTIIIAEAGVNHNGDIRIAKQLVDAAAMAGADYVKFQTFKTEELVSKDGKRLLKFNRSKFERLCFVRKSAQI